MEKENRKSIPPAVDGSARLVDPFTDLLRKKGVNCKGYGILFKFPMLDTALTIEAKGIYCYICSYAGSDSTAFPGREKILSDLRMCKAAYYKHYQLLLDNGYLRVEQKNIGGSSHGFLKNIYEIVERPEKFAAAAHTERLEQTYARIRAGGLHDAGFGYIPRAVMVDERLSVKAKALYGYYRSFSGAGAAACPEKKDLLYHLGISDKLYQRLMDELTSAGYLSVVQRHVNGRLRVNDIHIHTEPVATSAQGKTVCVIREAAESSFISQKQDTQINDTQKQPVQKQDTQNKDATKNNSNKNKNHQQQLHHQQSRLSASAEGGQADAEEISLLLWDSEGIPATFLGDRKRVGESLRIVTDYAQRQAAQSPDAEPGSSYLLFLEALTDMLCAAKPMTLTGERVAAEDVLERLGRYLRRSYARGTLTLFDLEELVVESYEEGCRSRQVKSPLSYCKACIWTALKTGDAALRARIAHDLGY